MPKWITSLILIWSATLTFANDLPFKSSIKPISKDFKKRMLNTTWQKGCPVAIDDLAYVELNYWGFDDATHQGVLIVHNHVAKEVVEIFKQLYRHRFPIQQMQPMETYDGDDIQSMMANNTSAFNCRANTTKPNQYSLHSYGTAIDINPIINPYVKGNKVLPSQGIGFLDRSQHVKGMIDKNSIVYKTFAKYGWVWGGDWPDRQDYQHFQKDLYYTAPKR